MTIQLLSPRPCSILGLAVAAAAVLGPLTACHKNTGADVQVLAAAGERCYSGTFTSPLPLNADKTASVTIDEGTASLKLLAIGCREARYEIIDSLPRKIVRIPLPGMRDAFDEEVAFIETTIFALSTSTDQELRHFTSFLVNPWKINLSYSDASGKSTSLVAIRQNYADGVPSSQVDANESRPRAQLRELYDSAKQVMLSGHNIWHLTDDNVVWDAGAGRVKVLGVAISAEPMRLAPLDWWFINCASWSWCKELGYADQHGQVASAVADPGHDGAAANDRSADSPDGASAPAAASDTAAGGSSGARDAHGR